MNRIWKLIQLSFLKTGICPVFCSGHGRYLQGRCHCEIGWKGFECNIRSSDCEIADCSGHGRCVAGQCICSPGYKGENCETTDCLDPDCGGHGACIDGQCMCKMGWRGVNCSMIDQRLSKYFPHCNNRGVYDLDTEKCSCFPGWLGDDCLMAKCDIDCGQHGICERGKCSCDSGWEGDRCERLACDSRCLEHGSCSNGTCVCVEGWMGKYCTFNGCPQSCSNHGSCRKGEKNISTYIHVYVYQNSGCKLLSDLLDENNILGWIVIWNTIFHHDCGWWWASLKVYGRILSEENRREYLSYISIRSWW